MKDRDWHVHTLQECVKATDESLINRREHQHVGLILENQMVLMTALADFLAAKPNDGRWV